MVKSPINNWIFIILGGAGFCPSTVLLWIHKKPIGESNEFTSRDSCPGAISVQNWTNP